MKEIKQTKMFQKAAKKLHPNEKRKLDEVVRKIAKAPESGDAKRGTLSGAYTMDYRMHGGEFRLMYKFDAESITLLRFGPRENFYR
ncbi:MAG TPA: type II toxin-antitoxin system RelE/ParE family toxin [Tichowtungia sp.]|nr:type II toxin-antitoxin system RelE/ParE family toxin [Tichowtungia sp.]